MKKTYKTADGDVINEGELCYYFWATDEGVLYNGEPCYFNRASTGIYASKSKCLEAAKKFRDNIFSQPIKEYSFLQKKKLLILELEAELRKLKGDK